MKLRGWYYEQLDKKERRARKNILHEKTEQCDQHKSNFKQDIYKYNII